jgi:hypothetical protein
MPKPSKMLQWFEKELGKSPKRVAVLVVAKKRGWFWLLWNCSRIRPVVAPRR